MKKVFFVFLVLLLSCEDDNEESPLVGVWEMNEMSGGLFMRVNKTQKIYFGSTEGEIKATTHINE